MNLCYAYSIKWRYEFNHVKSVTFGESKRVHSETMKERNCVLGGESVTELYEYKNLGVVKNYIGSFSIIADDKIDKTRKKAGMLFSSNFDRRKVLTLIYIKFWRQACLPTLLSAMVSEKCLLCTQICTMSTSSQVVSLGSSAHWR